MLFTTAQLLLFLASMLAGPKTVYSVSTNECSVSSSTQESLYDKFCCDESNVGQTLKIKERRMAQYILCPDSVPKNCKSEGLL